MSIPVKILLAALTVLALAAPRCIRLSGDLPQVGDADPVAVVLGDVRMLVARKMIWKADEYFHGGVTEINCTNDHNLQERHDRDNGEDEEPSQNGNGAAPLFAPWNFITSSVRLPPVERHLEGETTRELLPWLWAACRVDSGNVNAYANAAYVVESMYQAPEKALEVLDLGIAANPASGELEFQKGQLLLKLDRESEAVSSFAAAYNKSRKDKAEDHDLTAVRALGYLGMIAARNGDTEKLNDCREKAEAIAPTHSITLQLKQLCGE